MSKKAEERVVKMREVRNLNQKLVFCIDHRKKIIELKRGNCVVFIQANANGTLAVRFNEHAKRKRMLDISKDMLVVSIRLKNCLTYIKANVDMTLEIKHTLC